MLMTVAVVMAMVIVMHRQCSHVKIVGLIAIVVGVVTVRAYIHIYIYIYIYATSV